MKCVTILIACAVAWCSGAGLASASSRCLVQFDDPCECPISNPIEVVNPSPPACYSYSTIEVTDKHPGNCASATCGTAVHCLAKVKVTAYAQPEMICYMSIVGPGGSATATTDKLEAEFTFDVACGENSRFRVFADSVQVMSYQIYCDQCSG